MVLNEKWVRYFETGKIKEAILGEGSFFSPEITYYNQHDIGFVLDQLMKWAESVSKEKEAAQKIEESLPLFFDKKDKKFAVQAIWCLVVSRRKFGIGQRIPINMSKLGQTLLEFCTKNPNLINKNEELRGYIELICQHEPEIAKILGIVTLPKN